MNNSEYQHHLPRVITSMNEGYPELSLSEAMGMIKRKCIPCDIEYYGDRKAKDTVIILPEAEEELCFITGWGKRTPNNFFELMYQGCGHIFRSKDTNIVIITHFIYIPAEKRTATSAQIGADYMFYKRLEEEREIYKTYEKEFNTINGYEVDPFLKDYGNSRLVLLGHTHPNNLPVFFSEPDRASSIAAKNFPAVTFVLNPHRKLMKAMVGESEDVKIVVCRKNKFLSAVDNEDNAQKVEGQKQYGGKRSEHSQQEHNTCEKKEDQKQSKWNENGQVDQSLLIEEFTKICATMIQYGAYAKIRVKKSFNQKKKAILEIVFPDEGS